MEKTLANVESVIDNILAPEEGFDTVDRVILRDVYLKSGNIYDGIHFSKGKVEDYLDESVLGAIGYALDLAFNRYKPTAAQIQERDAETIIIKINGREFKTYLDARGVQRFRRNSLIEYIVDNGGYLLNDLSIKYQNGQFTDDEFLDFYTSFGYSVGGFCDLSLFSHYTIENPLWD